ncbi:MAG: peptidoglycan DD-metalloendopeptidase family protein [bacterium]|nr:peptidoglycan DD-metalloendopeptidase family protein [bacterium]
MNQGGYSGIFVGIIVAIVVATIWAVAVSPSTTVPPEITSEKVEVSPDSLPSLPISSKPEKKPEPTIQPTPNQAQEYVPQPSQPRDSWRDPLPPAPTNLALPIIVEDIDTIQGLLSPYGIIRKSGDGGIGHGGIDFPLIYRSPIYAVASGTIIKNNVEDSGGGKTVDVLIVPGEFQGEGWIFTYDHLALEPGLAVGSTVQKGQKIGINAFEQRGNNHIGLEYHVESFSIARTKICWVDLLEPTARQQLEDEFNKIKNTQTFLESWQTANAESYYQYKGLLDNTKYPDGPQLCYPLGTDARIPMY